MLTLRCIVAFLVAVLGLGLHNVLVRSCTPVFKRLVDIFVTCTFKFTLDSNNITLHNTSVMNNKPLENHQSYTSSVLLHWMEVSACILPPDKELLVNNL
jgi:hypothetical protein